MKPILVFSKADWNLKRINKLLAPYKSLYKTRVGFENILAVFDNTHDFKKLNPTDRVLHLIFHHDTRHIVSELIDLNVGDPEAIPFIIRGENILKNQSVPEKIRKLILDISALNGAIDVQLINKSRKKVIGQYAHVCTVTFFVRAQIEKMMLLLSLIDNNLNYKKLDSSKKIKKVFQQQAEKSDLTLTKKFAEELDNLTILDNLYRTPETHKLGRVLPLVYNGFYNTLLNEIFSYYNTLNSHFKQVCDFIEEKYSI